MLTKEESITLERENAGSTQAGLSPAHSQGINWSGPAGFWILLTVVVALTIGVGLYFG